MGLFECPYESTDERCDYYRCTCKGSKQCGYIKSLHWLKDRIGKLTVMDNIKIKAEGVKRN